jgi:hypothetical protein
MAKPNSISVGKLNVRETFKITGAKELDKVMKGIPPRIQQKIFKRAIKPSLKVMQDDAKENVLRLTVNEPTNEVRKSIASKIGVRITGRKGSKYATIGRLAVFYGQSANARPAFLKTPAMRATLAHLLEFGFRLTHYFGIPRERLGMGVKAIHKKPFMAPAFEDNRDEAERTFVDVVSAAVEEEDRA